MLPTLNYDAVLSDPLLLLAGVFLIAGPVVFLVSLIKLVSWGRKQKQEAAYADLNPFSPTNEPESPLPTPHPYMEMEPEAPPAPVTAPQSGEQPEDKTMIMPAGTGEVQGQLEIAFSQIKTLSKKVSQMESELDSVARNIIGKLDKNELKEIPMNPADFTQKLLKLAEHVIVLEKEVERLKNPNQKKGNGFSNATPPDVASDTPPPTPAPAQAPSKVPAIPSAPKPPMMPL